MRDINRINIFMSSLKEFWKDFCPDLRFWQVVCLLQNHANQMYKTDMWELEENQWQNVLDELIYNYSLKCKN